MSEIDVERGARPTVRSRGAGHSVVRRCLELQEGVSARGRLARALGRSPLRAEVAGVYDQALCELETGRRLQTLGPRWTVLHSVPIDAGSRDAESRDTNADAAADADVEATANADPDAAADAAAVAATVTPTATPGADIAQLVIGPAGVFCVAAARTLSVAETDAVARQARQASKQLSRLLQRVIRVTPVLAIAGAWKPAPGDPAPAVDVVASRDLPGWFAKRGPVLTTAELAVLVMTAEQPSTWSMDESSHSVVDFSAFRALSDDVDAASDRRQTVMIGVAVVAILVWLGVATVVLDAVDPQLFAH